MKISSTDHGTEIDVTDCEWGGCPAYWEVEIPRFACGCSATDDGQEPRDDRGFHCPLLDGPITMRLHPEKAEEWRQARGES